MAAASERDDIEAAWAATLAGETPAGDAADRLDAALREDAAFFAQALWDRRIHGMLGGLGRGRRERDGFVRRLDATLDARGDTASFVAKVEARLDAEVAAARGWWRRALLGGALAAAAVLALWLRAGPPPTSPRPELAPQAVVVAGHLWQGEARLTEGAVVRPGIVRVEPGTTACLRLGAARACLAGGAELRIAGAAAKGHELIAGDLGVEANRAATELPLVVTTADGEIVVADGLAAIEASAAGRASVRVLAGEARVMPARAPSRAVAVGAREGLALSTQRRWRLSRGEEAAATALALGLSSGDDDRLGGEPREDPPGIAARRTDDPGTAALVRLASALVEQGREAEAQGILGELERTRRLPADARAALLERRAVERRLLHPAPRALYRVNAGGPEWTDGRGVVWAADAHYNREIDRTYRAIIPVPIDRTDRDFLYQSQRADDSRDPPPLRYSFPAPAGTYEVRLHFVERSPYPPGWHVVDVAIEGRVVLAGYDLLAEVGAQTADVRQFVAQVTDGAIDVELHAKKGVASIAAIEILPLPAGATQPVALEWIPPAAPLPLPPGDALYRVNVGGPDFVDPAGRLWEADRYFAGRRGIAFANDAPIRSAAGLEPVYQDQRYATPEQGELSYRFPVAAGDYVVRLHLAENSPQIDAPGKRVFGIRIEGEDVAPRMDVFATVGPLRPLVKEFRVAVVDGVLDVDLIHVVDNPSIAAIEVLPASGGP